MHIPDGFLNSGVSVTMDAVSAGFLGYSIKKTFRQVQRKNMLLAGAVGAFIFAAQMVNFAITKGTSGHFLGGVFAGILLGPYMGMIVTALVLSIQMLIFQDGGLMALGANVFNMGVVGTIGGYYLYKAIRDLIEETYGVLVGAFVSSWASVVLAAFSCSLQLAISGVLTLGVLLVPMLNVHVMIGVGEGLITMALVSFVLKYSPMVINEPAASLNVFQQSVQLKKRRILVKKTTHGLLLMAMVLSIFCSPFASSSPDGLERVALDKGFIEKGEAALFRSPIPDYTLPGVKTEKIATSLAGLIGTLLTFGICYAAALLSRRGQ